jgi:NTP pyrophosphatase (non-canonical NTP hydrolase)
VENNNYQKWAKTKDVETYAPVANRLLENDNLLRLLHAAIGISGESGELLDTVKKSVFYGKALDMQNIKEELGDQLWYISLALESVGSSFSEVMELNRQKLDRRYPTGFTEKDAVARADKNT